MSPEAVGQRIKKLRCQQGLSMRKLAAKADIALSFLSRIEAGNASPTLTSLHKILFSLNMDLAEFFGESSRLEDCEPIVYSRESMTALEDETKVWHYLFPNRADIDVIMTYEEFSPGSSAEELVTHRGDMCGYVLAGSLVLEIDGRGDFKARKGDAFYVPAGRRHRARNLGRVPLKMVVAILK